MKRSVHLVVLLVAVSATPHGMAAAAERTAGSKSAPILAPRPIQNLPDLGSSANSAVSRNDEYQAGRQMMRELRTQNALLDDVETSDYLQSLGARIGVEAQEGEQRLTIFPVRDRSLNAFALPGGFIGVHTGLILLTQSEAELAGVVAHEIGHVVQRHIARAIQAQGRISMSTLAGMLGAVLVGAATGNADAIPGIVAIGQGTAMQRQINFTRGEEKEADRVGVGFLAAAGFDPNGMAGFFETMMRQRGLAGSDIPSLLLTHPTDPERLAETRARIASMPPMVRRPESENYPYIRERVRVLTALSGADLRQHFARERAAHPQAGAPRYGAALVELQAGNPKAAIALLRPLIAEKPELPLLHAALAQAQVAAGAAGEGLASFEHALMLSPRNVPLTIRYAEALMSAGQAKKAHQVLLDLFNNVAPTPEQIRLIALAANTAGDTGDAYSYMAEWHLANGDLELASMQLDLALTSPGLTEVQRKRFIARQDEILGVMREQPRRRPAAEEDQEDGRRPEGPRIGAASGAPANIR
jgi:beta-barrel assembly-enhancing protease